MPSVFHKLYEMERHELLALAHRLGLTTPDRRPTEEVRRAVGRRLSILRDVGALLPEDLDPALLERPIPA